MRKCISWNDYEKKYIFCARNTVDTWRIKCLRRTILGGKHDANAGGIGFDGKTIKHVPRAWRTGRQYVVASRQNFARTPNVTFRPGSGAMSLSSDVDRRMSSFSRFFAETKYVRSMLCSFCVYETFASTWL